MLPMFDHGNAVWRQHNVITLASGQDVVVFDEDNGKVASGVGAHTKLYDAKQKNYKIAFCKNCQVEFIFYERLDYGNIFCTEKCHLEYRKRA